MTNSMVYATLAHTMAVLIVQRGLLWKDGEL